MGMPARKLEQELGDSRHARPDLRVVRAPSAKKRTHSRVEPSRGRATDSNSIARQNFRMFSVIVVVVAVLGLGRVWLSVLAAEASLEASQLRHDIKTERYKGDMLEIQQSALGSPSRIRAVAGAAFDMAPAEDVTYVDLSEARPRTVASRQDQSGRQAGMDSAIAEVLDLAAGEAQVLLVGDVGLASAR